MDCTLFSEDRQGNCLKNFKNNGYHPEIKLFMNTLDNGFLSGIGHSRHGPVKLSAILHSDYVYGLFSYSVETTSEDGR